MIHGYCGLEYLCRPTKRIAILHRAKMPPSSPQLAAATATASSEGQRLHRTTPLVAAAAEANATATTTTTSTVAETARSESAAAQAAITTTTSTTTTNNNAHDAASAATSSSPFSYTELLYAVNSFYAIVQPGTFVVSSLDCTLKHSCVRQSLTMWLIDIYVCTCTCTHAHYTHSIHYHGTVGVGRHFHRHARIDRRHHGRAGTIVQCRAQLGSGYQCPAIGQ
jgi:hypothetical protein